MRVLLSQLYASPSSPSNVHRTDCACDAPETNARQIQAMRLAKSFMRSQRERLAYGSDRAGETVLALCTCSRTTRNRASVSTSQDKLRAACRNIDPGVNRGRTRFTFRLPLES